MATAVKSMTQYPGPRLVKKTGAEIQIEDGNYTRYHNHITEALMQVRLSGAERAVIDMILRQTYGYKRKAAQISYAEFERYLPYTRRIIMSALAKMVEWRIIRQMPTANNKAHIWAFNKYHEQWRVNGKPITPQLDMPPFGSDEADFSQPLTSEVDFTSLVPTSEVDFTTTSEVEFTRSSEVEFTPLKDKEKKEKTTTTDASETAALTVDGRRRRHPDFDPDFGEVCRQYESEIGPISAFIVDSLSELLDEYGSAAAIVDAFGIAAKNNQRKLSYVEGVLRNRRAEGNGGNGRTKAPSAAHHAPQPSVMPAAAFDV